MINQVRGTQDIWGVSADLHTYILDQARRYLSMHGFQEIITPLLEWENLFERSLGTTTDIMHKELFRLTRRGDKERDMVLRPEGTAPVMRAYLSHFTPPHPEKFMYCGPMFRYDRPQKGRLRQFTHVGVESIGFSTPGSDIEVITLALGFLKLLGVKGFCLEINTLGDEESRSAYIKVLVSHLKASEKNLSEDSRHRLLHNPLRILDSKSPEDQEILKNVPVLGDFLTPDSKSRFTKTTQTLTDLGIPYLHNEKLVRGLDYYSHTIFEITTDQLGAQGTILAGGRYDSLALTLGSKIPIPAVGWAMGVERVRLLLEETWILASPKPLALIPLEESCVQDILTLARTLVNAGFPIHTILEGKVGQKFKRAASQGHEIVLILGTDEVLNQTVSLKDLTTGDQKTLPQNDLISYLQKLPKEPS